MEIIIEKKKQNETRITKERKKYKTKKILQHKTGKLSVFGNVEHFGIDVFGAFKTEIQNNEFMMAEEKFHYVLGQPCVFK